MIFDIFEGKAKTLTNFCFCRHLRETAFWMGEGRWGLKPKIFRRDSLVGRRRFAQKVGFVCGERLDGGEVAAFGV